MRGRAWGLAAVLALAGCAGQTCDPRARDNIFQVGACAIGSGYQTRLDALRAEASRAEGEQAEALRERDLAQGRRDRLATEQAQLRADLAGERARSARMAGELAALRDRRGADRDRVAALDASLAGLREQQERLRAEAPGEAARRRHEELAAQRRTLERSLSEVNRSVQRE